MDGNHNQKITRRCEINSVNDCLSVFDSFTKHKFDMGMMIIVRGGDGWMDVGSLQDYLSLVIPSLTVNLLLTHFA